MKKKLRNLLSLILAVAMVATIIPANVKAADPIGFKMTGIDQVHVASGHLMVNVSPNLTTEGLTIDSGSGWSTVTQVPCMVGTSAEDAVSTTANAYGIWGTQILFESLLTANPTATYIKFAKDTQFVWNGVTFTLQHEFVTVNNEGTWEVQLPTFEMTTVDAGVSGDTHLMVNLDKNLTTLGVTVQSNGWSADYQVITCLAGTSAEDATERTANAYSVWGTQIILESFVAQNSGITYVKIEKGTQFAWGGISFELASDYIMERVDGTWTGVPSFEMTTVDVGVSGDTHLMVNINKNLTTLGITVQENGWSADYQVITCLAGTSAEDATERTANAYSVWGTQIIFESFTAQNPGITYVKLEKGTRFTWSGKNFELGANYIFEKVDGTWIVKEEEPSLPTFEMTSIDPANTNASNLMLNVNTHFETDHGVSSWTLVTSNVTYLAGTSEADATLREWGAVYALGTQIFFENLVGALTTETYVKIAKDTKFVWGDVTLALAEDFVMEKVDGTWTVKEEVVVLPTFEMTGINATHTGTSNLMLNATADFLSYDMTGLVLVKNNVTYWAGTSETDATSREWGAVYAFETGIFFENLVSALTTETYIKFAKDTQFVWEKVTYVLAEDFELEKVDGTWQIKDDTPAMATKVNFTGIGSIHIYPNIDNLVEMYLQTDVTWAEGDAALVDAPSIQIDGSAQSLAGVRQTAASTTLCLMHFGGASMSNGTVITIPAGTQFTIGGVTYEIEEDFAFRYDGANGGTIVGEEVNKNVAVDGRTWATSSSLFWTTDIPADDAFQGKVFTTSDIVIYRGEETIPIPSFTVHYDANSSKNTLFLQASGGFQAGDIVALKKGGSAVNEELNYKISFTTACTAKYLGGENYSDWVDYVEPVQIKGALSTHNGCMYLETDLGAEHRLFANNTGYASSDITITKADNTPVAINWITVDNNNGAICIGYDQSSLADGDILYVKSSAMATNAEYDYTMQFANGCLLKYDADGGDYGAWVSAYSEVGVTGIYYDVPADGNTGLKTTLYLALNWASADEYNKFAGKALATTDVWITRANGAKLDIGNIGIDSNPDSKAFSIYVADGFADGDVLHIKQNGIALHTTEKIGLTFTNSAQFYFEEGAWVYDTVGPEIYHDGTMVVDHATVDAKAGQNKSVFESHFYAADTETGLVDIFFTYSDGALDGNGNLVAGTAHTLTMTADDGHGNVTTRTITLNVEVVINLGDSNNDERISAIDLVGLRKAVSGNSVNTALYDLDGNGTVGVEDAAYLRAVLVGKYSIVAGQTISLPTYEGSAVLFADFPTDQTSESAVTTYFGANFTHMLMTEDTVALKSGDSVNASYLNAMNLIQMHGDVIVRNGQGAGGSFVDKSITDELANGGAKNFYYWDEPTLTELQNGTLNDLVTWHNTYNSDAMFHVNLFPSYATTANIGSSYASYIEAYVDNVLTNVNGKKTLCIDNYPLVNTNDTFLLWSTNEKHVRANYLSDMLTVANAVKNFNASHAEDPAELAFAIQSYGVSNAKDATTQRKIESYADITFQTNMAIAMGARSLEYFAYLQKLDAAEQAMIDGSGNTTSVYGYVANVNQAIQSWDHVFTSYDWQGAMMYGDTSSDLYNNAKSQFVSSFNKATVSADKATVVSEFKDAESNYAYMAVNATEPSEGEMATVSFTFSGATKAVVYRNGEASVEALSGGALTVALGAGEGAFCIPIY